jgi:hypothetical protein
MALLDDYLLYTTIQESPTLYHKWVCIAMVASCLERNVWLDRGFYKVFPNLYTMLIGDSAVYKKSTAIEIGKDLLYAIPDKPTMYEGQITVPQLVMDMGGQEKDETTDRYISKARITVLAPELSVFLRNKDMASEMIDFLTDFYTCKTKEWKARTKTAGKAEIASPCINFLAASTAEWLAKGITQADFGGGFMGRCLFIVPTELPRRIAHPSISPEQKDARQRVIAQLTHIRTLRGQYSMSDDAKAYYDHWYNSRPIIAATDRLKGYYERKAETVLKIAIIKATMDDSLEVGIEELKWAVQSLDALEPAMPAAFQFIGTDENVLAELVVSHLDMMGGKDTYVRVLAYMSPRLRNKQHFDNVITMLTAQEKIESYDRGGRYLALKT